MYDQETQTLKIIDFEIAKMKKYENQKLSMWTNTGTLYQKAPEIFEGVYDQKADIWALRVLIYQLITGYLPFYSVYQNTVIKKIISSDVQFSELVFTPICQDFISKCLIKDPSQRFQIEEAIRSPFLLKHDSSHSTPKGKRQVIKRAFTFDLSLVKQNVSQIPDSYLDIKKFYDKDSQIYGKESLSTDIGIRHFIRL